MSLRSASSPFVLTRSLGLWLTLGTLGLAALPVGCGTSGESDAGTGATGGSDEVPRGGGGSAGEGNGTDGEDLSGTGDDGSGLGRSGFRFGINLGHPNPDFDDAEMSDLAAGVGTRSIRIKYPEYHFDTWGQEIEVGDAKHYAELGMKDHVAFVIGMTEAHSTAPSGSADWERDDYIPKNLYEPIFTDAGEINAENYYAKYLADTFSTYKNWVKYWEIFNEPDWISDWHVAETWDTEPPSAEDLVRFHGSIFDYIRMLRIASAVRDFVAPNTYILTGGLGYPSFVSALLRYTDNPDGGKATDRYPEKGGAYFDVLSIHYYPHLLEDGSSDAGLLRFEKYRDDMLAELEKADVAAKGIMVTETGAAHVAIDGSASGSEYARNYAQKAMIWAKAEGFLGVDWFTLSDGKDATDPFARMGLYEDVSALSSTSEAVATETGRAYETVSFLLGDARLDIKKTEALELPSGARGYAFASGEKVIYALWAVTGAAETASASASIPLEGSVEVWEWDAGDAGPTTTRSATGNLSVELSGSPTFFVGTP